MKTILKQQRGVTFGGFIVIAALLGVLAIFSMKLIPAYLENAKIQKSFESIVRDPAMKTATIAEIRDSFYKRSNVMDNVTTVSSGDIEVIKEGAILTLSVTYNVKIPFAGNVSLLIEFNPTATK